MHETGTIVRMRRPTAFASDVFVILLFAVIGRNSHEELTGVGAVASTAAPFLIALVVGWALAVVAARLRPDIVDPVTNRGGGLIWVTTVVGGLVLRRVAWDRGTAPAFVIVAAVFLFVTIVGVRVAARTRSRSVTP